MATDEPPQSQLSSFTVLPLTYPPTSAYPHRATHYLYIRAHAPQVPDPTKTPRSLFIANIPVDATHSQIRALFARDSLGGGRVEKVEFGDAPRRHISTSTPTNSKASGGAGRKRKRGAPRPGEDENELIPMLPSTRARDLHASGSSAVVIFVDRPSMESALRAVNKAAKRHRDVPWSFPELEAAPADTDRARLPPPLGRAGYKLNHALTFPDREALQAAVDAYMTSYAELEARRAAKVQRLRNVPDEDGFVTVVRGARAGGARVDGERAEELRRVLEEKRRKEAESKVGLPDFYRFQVRERLKAEAGTLVKRFEDDKQRVYGGRGRGRGRG